ncbi:hypothetical protein MHH60_26445 [Paenibacillus sp. FSL H7-0716]|uniref:Bacteriophage SP-beta YorD domain-containing protein n=1 Tax=Paenibacillus odorifer TaxID=189426 RepID=A0AB36J305_9BACL|nr:hypothetical protein [Paenibacillus odorifer]OME10529.1 hypothetical protein BSK47_30460 [Paenibacillus odorifer]
MKLVPRTELEGQYIDDVSVDDSFTGVVPIYAQPEPEKVPELPEDEEIKYEPDVPEEPEQPREIIGYLVGIPLPTGLYHPKFDLLAWDAYQDAVLEAQSDYVDAMHDWQESYAEGVEQGEQPIYTLPTIPDNLWVEGLTPEEIAELTKPGEQTEVEKLKFENEALKKLIEDKDRENKNALFEIYSILLGGE